jgi:superfamily I DNA/RNA helicase
MQISTLFGGAGTGKTRYLISDIERVVKAGTTPNDITYVSFTKAAIQEAINRVLVINSFDRADFKSFSTIHSACFKALSLKKDSIITEDHLNELSEDIGFKLSTNILESVYSLPKGDLALQLDNLARLKLMPLRAMYDSLGIEAEFTEIQYIVDKYNLYKKSNSLLDFTDMLQLYLKEGMPLGTTAFYVDEAQDLNTLQWKVVEKMAAYSEYLMVAGDDDQAIYQWSGADVDYFLDFADKSNKIILDKSYRCKSVIRDFAFSVVKKLSRRENKTYAPVCEGGTIEYYNNLLDADLSEGQWKILVRNNYLQKKVISFCKDKGYFYNSIYDNKKSLIRALICYEDLKRNKGVETKEFIKILEYITDNSNNTKYILTEKFKGEKIYIQDLTALNITLPLDKSWFDAFQYVPYEDILYIRAMLRQGEKLREEPRITIESIHASKGTESENVLLLTDISKKTFQGMQRFQDPELRCQYVAITRAKNKLIIINPESKYSYEV